MGSLGVVETAKKKAMWLYPKVLGFNPSERWGHSACYSHGLVYVFGGCCGGLHFSDVLVLNLDTMTWDTLVTTGQGPGPRDSHSAVILGQRMVVFGGTNGSKKVNDLHILDLGSKEWARPECRGAPPSPRESHTVTLLGDDKLVIFGGSGEGEANYLNDLHVLDLKAMRWSSPEVLGDTPSPRDSHSAVGIGNKLIVYGGDCGDRYHGDVDILDMDTLTWSRLSVQGSSPGVRAGHAAVSIGTKVYIIGGVGDKHYYNDVWVLDVFARSWNQLEIRGQQPQGRFSHTAIVTDSDIAIYGGCGEDERPLNELLVLQLGSEHPNGRYNISLCKIFGNHWSHGKRRVHREAESNSKTMLFGNDVEMVRRDAGEPELESNRTVRFSSDTLHPKRRRTGNLKGWEIESEQEEHSLSLSQSSSPSQSDQEQTPVGKGTDSSSAGAASLGVPIFRQPSSSQANINAGKQKEPRSIDQSLSSRHLDVCYLGERQSQAKPENFHRQVQYHHQPAEQKPLDMIGAEIRGKVDGAFDSGYLMTATVNGQIFRGVLFSPGPAMVSRGGIVLGQGASPPVVSHVAVTRSCPKLIHAEPSSIFKPSQQAMAFPVPEPGQAYRQAMVARPSPVVRSVTPAHPKLRTDLQGVVLTLGGPGSSHGGL